MRVALLAASAALLAPAAASAAPFGELPFSSLPDGVSCVRATGAPGELVLWAPNGARLERVSAAGLSTEATVDFGPSSGCPVAAARPGGAAVVAGVGHEALSVAVRDPGGAVQPPASIPVTAGAVASAPAVAVAPSGAAVATWFEIARDAVTVRAARRAAGGAFGAPEQLARIAATAFDPDNRLEAGIADDGTATVAWTLRTNSGTIAQLHAVPLAAAVGAPGAPFAAAQVIAPEVDALALAVAADGRSLLAFVGDGRVQVAERPPGGAFGAADVVGTSSDSPGGGLAATLAADGSAVVAWNGGGYDDLQIARRTGLGVLGPAVQLVPSHLPDEGSFSGGTATVPDSPSDVLPADETGTDLRALTTPDGRTLLTWGSTRSGHGLHWLAPRLAVVGPGAVSAFSQVLGGPLRDVATLAPVLTDAGVPAIAWGDARLHVALEGAPDVAPAPLARVKIGRPVHSALRLDDPLVIPVACAAACDVSATMGHFQALGSLARAGTLRLTFAGSKIAPPKPGAVTVRIAAGPPGARSASVRTIHPVLRRVPDPPLPKLLGLTAMRHGSKLVVTWHLDRPAKQLRFFVTGLDPSHESSIGAEVEGTSGTAYTYTFDRQTKGIRSVHLEEHFDEGFSSRTASAPVR